MQYASKKEEYSQAWQLLSSIKDELPTKQNRVSKAAKVLVLCLCFALFSQRELYSINSVQFALPIKPKVVHTQVRKRQNK